MKLTGASETQARAWVGGDTRSWPTRVDVLACCLPAVRLFVAMAGQWRMMTAGVQGPVGTMIRTVKIGLDLGALDTIARWLDLEPSAQLLADLRVMECEVLKIEAARA